MEVARLLGHRRVYRANGLELKERRRSLGFVDDPPSGPVDASPASNEGGVLLGGIDPATVRGVDRHGDSAAVLEDSQLLQPFCLFQRRFRPGCEPLEEVSAIRIKSHVSQGGGAHGIAIKRDQAPAEVDRLAVQADHNFHLIRVRGVAVGPEGRRNGGHIGLGIVIQGQNHRVDRGWIQLRLIALNIDDDGVGREFGGQSIRHFSETTGAVGMIEGCLDRLDPSLFDDPDDLGIWGGDDDPFNAQGGTGTIHDMEDQGSPGLIRERLAGESSGPQSRRNHDRGLGRD